jgi:hypothetical protein
MEVLDRTFGATGMSEKHVHLNGMWQVPPSCIVLLVLAVLSWPSHADTLQPGWVTDSKAGCRVWNPAPKPNENVTWSGACENGYAQGQGVEQWYSDGKPLSHPQKYSSKACLEMQAAEPCCRQIVGTDR